MRFFMLIFAAAIAAGVVAAFVSTIILGTVWYGFLNLLMAFEGM